MWPVSGSISTSAMWHAVRKGQRRLRRRLGVEVFGNLAALLHLRGARGDLEQRDAAVGADHFEVAVLVDDVGFAGFQHGGGDRLALLQDGLDRLDDANGRPSSPSASRPRHSRGSRSTNRRGVRDLVSPECRAARRSRAGNTVAWPWPVFCTLSVSSSVPSPGKLSIALSIGAPPACSSMQQMPKPRYLPRFCASRRRFLKPS